MKKLTLKLKKMFNLRHQTISKILKKEGIYKQILLNKSTQPAVQNAQEEYDKQLKDFQKMTKIVRKTRVKKPQRPPFAKNLFVGVFDREVLTYPQLEKEETEILENDVKTADNLVNQTHMVDVLNYNKNFRQNLADYRLIGLQCPSFNSGRECNLSEYSKILETLLQHESRYSILHNEQLGVQTLIKFGSDYLKQKYLEPLMNGSLSSAFCLAETNFSDLVSMKSIAKLSDDGKHWILNGEKVTVVNGNSADILIVLAVTEVTKRDLMKDIKLTAFVVEKNFEGVSCNKHDKSDLEVSKISFKNTPIPVENVLGEVNNALKVVTPIISEFRLSYGVLGTAIGRILIKKLHDHIVENSTEKIPLYKLDAIRGVIGKMVSSVYALESMTYLTTGLLDSYENQDCSLETAIVKLYGVKCLQDITVDGLNLVGSSAIEDSHWCNKLYKDNINHICLNETPESLKLSVALLGLSHAGTVINDTVKVLRNPFFHATKIMKRIWTNRKNDDNNPTLNLHLEHELHPSLMPGSKALEYSVLRLAFASETLLSNYGNEIVDQHMELDRIAKCIVDIYAMTACLARASRSYCIGLQHSDWELLIANSFCNYAKERVDYNVMKIFYGEHNTNDENYRAIAKRTFKFKGYDLKHPLSRNF